MEFREAILRQPDNLLGSAAVFLDALERLELSAYRDGPILFTGMGASLFAVVPAAAALRAAGRDAFALPATEVLEPGGERLGRACVGVSQSGESAETVAAFRRLSVPRLALTNDGAGPLAEVAEVALPIGSMEDLGISVLTYTASLFATAALAVRLGANTFNLSAADLSDHLTRVIAELEPVSERVAERLDGVRALDLIGTGTALASAGYAALAIREAARVPTAWFQTHQYLHGPIEVAESGVGAVVFGSGREIRLAQDLAGLGVPVLLVTDASVSLGGTLEVFRLPEVDHVIAPVLQAVPAQLVAEAMARHRGISPGALRHQQEDTRVNRR